MGNFALKALSVKRANLEVIPGLRWITRQHAVLLRTRTVARRKSSTGGFTFVQRGLTF